MVPEGAKGAINLFIELEKHTLNQIDEKKHKNHSTETCSFLEVKLRLLRRKTRTWVNMRDKRQHALCLQIVLMKQPGPAPQYQMQMQASNISRINPSFPHFAPRKQISCVSTWQTAGHANNRDVNINRTVD